jgi:hypothetical protein
MNGVNANAATDANEWPANRPDAATAHATEFRCPSGYRHDTR